MLPNTLNSSNGRVYRASVSGAVDAGLIPSQVQAMIANLAFRAWRSALRGPCGEQVGKFTS